MKVSPILAFLLPSICFCLPACDAHKEVHAHQEPHKILVTTPKVKDVVITQQYVCQIRSQCYIEVCALVGGRLEEILSKEGQSVKKGDPMFRVLPTLYQAKLDAEMAEVKLAQIEFENTERLYNNKNPVVSKTEVSLYQAKLAKAQAVANRTKAEVDFTLVRAPFDGIVDRLPKQLGSTIKEGEILTTLSDNRVMWVYYNVPEVRYLEYMAEKRLGDQGTQIELVLANGAKFPHQGRIAAIEAKFNNETGNIPFRADFPNPEGLLRHGQTGNVLINKTLKNALVIPQRATFEILDKRFVFVIDPQNAIRQREVEILHEMDDIFVIGKGLAAGDKIVLEGVRQVKDGDKLEFEFRDADAALSNQKNHAE